MSETIRVICGPTGAGKSALAMRLATQAPIIILSADSRQIYRGFDIGTAKPTPYEQSVVAHRGIDIVDPVERYSAAAWADAAAGWIAEARACGREPVIVGGTGFYLRALFAPLFEEPSLPVDRRAALAPELGRMPVAELRRWCAVLDPGRAHLGRTQLLRAIEVALLTGERLSDLHRATARAPRFRARYLVVDPGPTLGRLIEGRVSDMLDRGWEDEVRRLAADLPPDAPAWNATGYALIRSVVQGEAGRDAAIERIVIESRQYAKRQRTWFRHQLASADVTRIDPRDAAAVEVAVRWWRGVPARIPGEDA